MRNFKEMLIKEMKVVNSSMKLNNSLMEEGNGEKFLRPMYAYYAVKDKNKLKLLSYSFEVLSDGEECDSWPF